MDKFKDFTFDHNAWSAPRLTDPNEIKARLDGFKLVGRKIKDVIFVGECNNLIRMWIEEHAYQETPGSEENKQYHSDYNNISPELTYSRCARIDEPFMIKFEDDENSHGFVHDEENDFMFNDGETFEIDTPWEYEYYFAMNTIPWGINAGTNPRNADARVLFAPCIGRTVAGVEVNVRKKSEKPSPVDNDRTPEETVNSIVLRFDDGSGLAFEPMFDYDYVYNIDKDDNILELTFAELKTGLYNYEDLHVDEITGLEANGTFYFGKIGMKHCPEPYMVLKPSSNKSELRIPERDFLLFNWSLEDLFEWYEWYGDELYTFADWQKVLAEAEKLLSFETFDDLFDYRVSLLDKASEERDKNTFLSGINCNGKRFWNTKSRMKTQLNDMKEWTSLALKDGDTLTIFGY